MLAKDQITAERFSACQAQVCCQCVKCSWWRFHLSHGSVWINGLFWGYWLPGTAELLWISQLHWQQCWGDKGLQQIFPLFFHPLLFQGMSRWGGLAHAFAEPDISILKDLLFWRGAFPHANVQNRHSILFTKQILSDKFSAVFWDRP